MPDYPPDFPFRGTIIKDRRLNNELIPVLLSALVQTANWWSKQNVAGSEKLRLARYIREAYVTVEEITDEMKEPDFWEEHDLYVITTNLKDMLDRLAPTGFYFGTKRDTMEEYGFYDDSFLVGPYPVWE